MTSRCPTVLAICLFVLTQLIFCLFALAEPTSGAMIAAPASIETTGVDQLALTAPPSTPLAIGPNQRLGFAETLRDVQERIGSIPYSRTLEDTLRNCLRLACPADRAQLLYFARSWNLLYLRPAEWIFMVVTFLGVLALVIIGNKLRGVRDTTFKSLFVRDFGPESWDSADNAAPRQVQYRGILHWLRDAMEKGFSLLLLLTFWGFMAKGVGYVWDYARGEGWRLCLLPLDLELAINVIGGALIIDGFVLVASMTDAPGISRTIDAVIVVLAGYVVMQVRVVPGLSSFVSFDFRVDWLCAVLSGVIAILFLTRWAIRQATFAAWYRGNH